jgi:hypothetical protein
MLSTRMQHSCRRMLPDAFELRIVVLRGCSAACVAYRYGRPTLHEQSRPCSTWNACSTRRAEAKHGLLSSAVVIIAYQASKVCKV